MSDDEAGGDARPRPPANQMTQAIRRSPSVSTALTGFGAYMFGVLALMVSVYVALPGLLFVLGTLGTGGWQDRGLGVVLLVIGASLFLTGRWAVGQFSVQRRT